MGLNRYKLGDLIKQRREKYDGKEELQSWGVSRDGFIRPKQEDADTSIYNVFYRNDFVFNPARMELNSIALNTSYDKAICSSLYEVFYVTREDIVLPEYLNMFIKRDEFARRCWYEAIGSARNYFRVGDLSQFNITLPSIEQQRKYVDVYLSLQKNLEAYQSKNEEMKLVCDGFIEDLRRKMKCERIAKYISKESKNTEGRITKVLGIGQNGFMEPQKDPNESLRNYKILRKGDIAYAPPLYNILTGALHCYTGDEDAVCSPIYEVFSCDKKHLLPDYLTIWLKRSEFIRYAEYYAQGVRQTFDFSLMEEIEIPIPSIDIQQSISNIFKVYLERKSICEELKSIIKNLCPILIKGSLQKQ